MQQHEATSCTETPPSKNDKYTFYKLIRCLNGTVKLFFSHVFHRVYHCTLRGYRHSVLLLLPRDAGGQLSVCVQDVWPQTRCVNMHA